MATDTEQFEREMAESLERARLRVAAEKEWEQNRNKVTDPPPQPPLPQSPKVEVVMTPFVAKANDPVSHPAHYTAGRIECIDAIESAIAGLTGIEAFDTGQVFKYLWRWKRKNGVEDLEKARWYLEHLLRHVKPSTPSGNDG